MADRDNPGVPLSHYRQHNAGVLLTCRKCYLARPFGLEAVIKQLRARGTGDENTGIRAVAALTTQPCPRCGGTVFESTPDFPRAMGQGGF